MKERFKLVPAVYLYFEEDGKLLFLHRFNTGYEDKKYALVSGHADGNETLTQALAREVKEEVGVHINPNSLVLVHIMHRNAQEHERIDVFFSAPSYDGELVNNEPQKHDELTWFDKNALPENTVAYVRKAIEHIQNGVLYSEYGW